MRAHWLLLATLLLSLRSYAFSPVRFVPQRSLQRTSRVVPTAVLDGLVERISGAVKSIGGVQRITENAVAGALKDVKRALLDSDVNLQVANSIVADVKKRAVGVEVTKGVTAEQQFIKFMYDALVEIMGGNATSPVASHADPTARPTVVLMAGLQGAGKTTSAAKLALAIKQDGEGAVQRGALLAAADIYRPAAIKQLEILGESIGVEVINLGTEISPVEIASRAVERAEELQREKQIPYTVIIDTAGRQVIDGPLMEELSNVKKAVTPDEVLLVVDAMTGQEAATITARFNDDIGITGAILTKLDGDTRGGAAISVRAVSGCPIKLVGMGETMKPLEPFYPDRLASRILGMGDVVSLVEKAQESMEEEEAMKIMQKMKDATFDFDDFLTQAEMVSSMGSMSGVMGMLPGMSQMGVTRKQMDEAEIKLARHKTIIDSMTKKERKDPNLLITDRTSSSRIKRIAKGSGNTEARTQAFLAEFQQMRTMMSRMSKMQGAPGNEGTEAVPAGMGNRKARRKAAKSKKTGRSSGGGFGKK